MARCTALLVNSSSPLNRLLCLRQRIAGGSVRCRNTRHHRLRGRCFSPGLRLASCHDRLQPRPHRSLALRNDCRYFYGLPSGLLNVYTPGQRMRSVRDGTLTITCELCGHEQWTSLSEAIAQPAIECAAGCGQVNLLSPATLAAILKRYGGEVLDLSRWEPPRVRRPRRERRVRRVDRPTSLGS